MFSTLSSLTSVSKWMGWKHALVTRDGDEEDVFIFLSSLEGTDNDTEGDDGAPDPQEVLSFVLKCNWESSSSSSFYGSCIDFGAQKTVLGLRHARVYGALVTVGVKKMDVSDSRIYTFGSL